MPRKYSPTAAQMNERVVIPLPVEEDIIETGPPHDDASPEMKEAARQETEYPTDETDEG